MKYQRVNFLIGILSIFVIVSCNSTTPTALPTLTPSPVPLSEINLEPILIISGDLPAGYSGAQIRTTPPEMFNNITNFNNAIYQQFEKDGKSAGGVAIFLFESVDNADIAFQKIVGGFGESGESANLKTTVENISNVGEKATVVTIETSLSGLSMKFTDFAFVRCHAIVHIRMSDTVNADYLTGYGIRLDKRLSELVCR